MPPPCKCCRSAATFELGVVDFNKSCMDRFGERVFPPSEVLVPYYSCRNCGFIFTDFMDGWTREDFVARVYNDEYRKADPALMIEGGSAYPKDTLAYHGGLSLAARLRGAEDQIRILDFGAGGDPGIAGSALIDQGFKVDSYEPNFIEPREPQGLYQVIVLTEVIEHCHDLDDVVTKIARHLAPDGLVVISTMLHPPRHDASVLNSWYIAPRNGHISIFSLPALAVLFRRYGLNVAQTLFGLLAFREKPRFRNDFFV